MLSLGWRMFDLDGFLAVQHRKVKINEVLNDSRGSGSMVWDGAIVLAKFLEKYENNNPGWFQNKFVLELGAGTGLVGLATWALGAKHVCLTDLEYALSNIQQNIDSNEGAQQLVYCVELDWAKHGEHNYLEMFRGKIPNVICLADVCWIASSVPILVAQLVSLCRFCHPTLPRVFLAHQTRSNHTDDVLFATLKREGFEVHKLKDGEYHEDYHGLVDLYELVFTI